jgi:hypothetical protein
MEKERSYTISIGFYFGILLGTRAYEEEDFIYVCIILTIY